MRCMRNIQCFVAQPFRSCRRAKEQGLMKFIEQIRRSQQEQQLIAESRGVWVGGRWPEWPLEVNVGAITLFVFYASTSLFLMLLVFYIRTYNKCVPLASSQSSTFSISIHIPQLCRSKVIQLEFPVCVYCRRSSRGVLVEASCVHSFRPHSITLRSLAKQFHPFHFISFCLSMHSNNRLVCESIWIAVPENEPLRGIYAGQTSEYQIKEKKWEINKGKMGNYFIILIKVQTIWTLHGNVDLFVLPINYR